MRVSLSTQGGRDGSDGFVVCVDLCLGHGVLHRNDGVLMSSTLIAITGLIYMYVACEMLARGNVPMAITYSAYSLANVGLWMMAK